MVGRARRGMPVSGRLRATAPSDLLRDVRKERTETIERALSLIRENEVGDECDTQHQGQNRHEHAAIGYSHPPDVDLVLFAAWFDRRHFVVTFSKKEILVRVGKRVPQLTL